MALHQVGARTEGDVYQGLFFWRQAADLLRPNSLVERVVLEHDAADGVDDVAVFYRAPGVNAGGWQASADYFQLKYHVDNRDAYSADALIDPSFINAKVSLLQRFQKAYAHLSKQERVPFRLHLASNWRWKDDDKLASLLREYDGALPPKFFEDGAKGALGKVREKWRAHLSLGIARFGALKDIGNVFAIKSFEDQRGEVVRAWSGRELGDLAKERRVNGFWWLWPQPVVLRPWQAPGTWRDLRRIAKAMNIDVDAMLRWLFPQLRGSKSSAILMLGYPMPRRVGEDASEVHWDAMLLPRLDEAVGQPRGFRPNARGWWHRDRFGKFADTVALEYLFTNNWSGERLQARGRLPRAVRDCNIAVLGVGALGSVVSELLVRAGVKNITLVDDDVLESGNVNRHVATLVDVGKSKVPVVAQRLRQISPTVRVAEFSEQLPSGANAIETQLDEYDIIIIDCTSSDVALATLERAWWSIPRTFASFSMGIGGKRLFSFGISGNRFPHGDFTKSVRPWLEYELKAWADNDEVLEGAGCWSPLFPARYDDVVLAAAVCVKELETLVAQRPTVPRFRVFAQSSSEDGFQGFVPESAPPALEALAS